MTLAEANKELKRVGTSQASGDALRAMYARLITFQHCLDSVNGRGGTTLAVYIHLQKYPTDDTISSDAHAMLRDWQYASDVAFMQEAAYG